MDQLNMYQGVNYKNKREKVQTLLLHLTDKASTSNYDTNTMFDTDHVNFRVTLQEPMIIDQLSDVYLEFVLTSGTRGKDPLGDQTAFLLSIDQFKVNSVSNQSNSFNKIIIPNEHSETSESTPAAHVTLHKSNKLNYVCSINPCKLYELSGKLTFLNGLTTFYPHREPISAAPSPPNTNVSNRDSVSGAHDLGYLDVTKSLVIRADVVLATDHSDVSHDTEMFIFKSTASADTPTGNTLIAWETLEHSATNPADPAADFYDHNDDSVGVESKLTYTANQLPVMNGYYWIGIGPYGTDPPVSAISAATTVDVLGATMVKSDGEGSNKSWDGDHKLHLNITSDGGSVDTYSRNSLVNDSADIYWFRFESPDHSKNVVTQFNIIPRR